MKLIDIQENTIIMMVGPSNSGKSHLALNHIIPFLEQKEIRSIYLSSDKIRRELLGDEIHKHDSRMGAVSKQAFELLYKSLDIYTQYPVNIPVVVLDATNLSRVSRANVYDIAEKNAYKVVVILFDYKSNDDYYKYLSEGTDKRVIFDMVKKMRNETIRELEKNRISSVIKLDSIDFSDVKCMFSNNNQGIEIKHKNICAIGDIHGCYDEFIAVLQDNKGLLVDKEAKTINIMSDSVSDERYIHHVLIGDLIDKGGEEGIRNVIEFVHANMNFFTMLEGNHERWVYNYLKGKIKSSKDNDILIDNYFDTVKILQNDEELKKKFFEIYDNMYTFAYNDKVIFTHAPCENKYLKKSDKVSLKKQNTIMYPKEKDFDSFEAYLDAREKFFEFLLTDGEFNAPYHVFGHVPLSIVYKNKNKIGLDTGCVTGNYLSTVLFSDRGPFIKKYPSTRPKKDKHLPFFRVRTNDVDYNSLEKDVKLRVKWLAANKVNFISGTMSPCDKDANCIESIESGIEYFLKNDVKALHIQPKFMGSRCNLLLHVDDVTKCKLISRNGYEIKQERLYTEDLLTEMLLSLQKKYEKYFNDSLEYILFDGELLPWNVMGKDLIEKEFHLAYKAASSENDLLKETGFQEVYDAYEEKYQEDKKYEGGDASQKKRYDAFKDEILNVQSTEECLAKYKKQLDIFSGDDKLHFKPFSVLKTISSGGTEVNCINSDTSNLNTFRNISNEPSCYLDFENSYHYIFMGDGTYRQFETSMEAVKEFWSFITQNKQMEGVVIKPDTVYIPNVAPYMKCRNPEYLRLTYGFDYDYLPVKTAKLMRSKSIKRKLDTSIKEWELGKKLLDVKMSEISIDNKKWLSLVLQLISEQDREKELDPRL